MKLTVKSPDSAKSVSGASSHFRISAFSVTDFPKSPLFPLFTRNPPFPASGPAASSFNGLHPKSNFLARSNPLLRPTGASNGFRAVILSPQPINP
jgi:hypothetical protein